MLYYVETAHIIDFMIIYVLAIVKYWFTVSFHNFKSQKFKLSVSNPKNKYVAYLSVYCLKFQIARV